MILKIDGKAVIDSDSLDAHDVLDGEIRLNETEEGDVVVRSDGPVAIKIRHEGVDERTSV